MPRVVLNPEMRATKSLLGDLPTALGIDVMPKTRQKRYEFDVPEAAPIRARPALKPELRVKTAASKAVAVAPTHEKPRVDAVPEFDQEQYLKEAHERYRERYIEGQITDESISKMQYEPRKGGRPSDYTKKHPIMVFNFALLGLSDERIAAALGISIETFYQWHKTKPGFAEALVDGRENVDGLIVNAMFKKAVGFKYDAVKIFHNKDDGTVYAPYEEYVPPDVGAGKFLLGIRRGRMRKDGWEDTSSDGNGVAPPAVQVNINVSDPQEAAKQYRQFIQGEVL